MTEPQLPQPTDDEIMEELMQAMHRTHQVNRMLADLETPPASTFKRLCRLLLRTNPNPKRQEVGPTFKRLRRLYLGADHCTRRLQEADELIMLASELQADTAPLWAQEKEIRVKFRSITVDTEKALLQARHKQIDFQGEAIAELLHTRLQATDEVLCQLIDDIREAVETPNGEFHDGLARIRGPLAEMLHAYDSPQYLLDEWEKAAIQLKSWSPDPFLTWLEKQVGTDQYFALTCRYSLWKDAKHSRPAVIHTAPTLRNNHD